MTEFIHKTIIGFKPIKYTPFWWWYRLVCHTDYRLDDRHLIKEFWSSLNQGWEQEQYILKFEEYWGKGSYPPERIIISESDYDHLRERLLEPPDPEVQERMKQIMSKPAPWETDHDLVFHTNGEEQFRISADQPWYQPRTTDQQLLIDDVEE